MVWEVCPQKLYLYQNADGPDVELLMKREDGSIVLLSAEDTRKEGVTDGFTVSLLRRDGSMAMIQIRQHQADQYSVTFANNDTIFIDLNMDGIWDRKATDSMRFSRSAASSVVYGAFGWEEYSPHAQDMLDGSLPSD
jgi:hypothetical protein